MLSLTLLSITLPAYGAHGVDIRSVTIGLTVAIAMASCFAGRYGGFRAKSGSDETESQSASKLLFSRINSRKSLRFFAIMLWR